MAEPKGLRFRILFKFFTLLAAALIIHAVVGYITTRKTISKIARDEAEFITEVLYGSLYHYMLKGAMELVQFSFDELKRSTETIKSIMLTDNNLIVKRATDRTIIGHRIPEKYVIKKDFAIIREGDRLETVRVLRNAKKCVECHSEEPRGGKIGILVVSFDFKRYSKALSTNFVIYATNSVVIILLLGFGLYYILTKDVITKVMGIARDVVSITKGEKPRFHLRDDETEFGTITTTLERMYTTIVDFLRNSLDAVKKLYNVSSTLSDMSREQEKSASNVSSSVHQISTTTEELSISSRRVHEQAREIYKKGEEILKISKEGEKALDKNRENMEKARKITKELSSQVLVLNEHIREVGNIVEMVRELSDKTDLLAVNASIEAAKGSGENKGFQVVAEEIRRLSDLSKESLGKITRIIEEIENIVSKLVFSAEDELKVIDETFVMINVTYDTMKNLLDILEESIGSFSAIDAATKEQSDAIKQVADSLSLLFTETNKAVKASKELHKSSTEISKMADELKKVLEGSFIKGYG